MPNNALLQIKQDTLKLIDDLKVICTSFGLGNDGNEYKIITQCLRIPQQNHTRLQRL